jgi:hypothetical protein
MERNLLYYPYIDIPNKEWLYSAILYTDSISTIVPYQNVENEEFPESLKPLLDAGVYKPVFIEKLLRSYNNEFQFFEKSFINSTTSEKFKNMKKDVHIEQPTILFEEKMTYNIMNHLKQENLIRRTDGNKIFTEQNTALLYMSLLAQYVAKIDTENLVIPSTDLKEYERMAFDLSESKINAYNLLLDKVLPTPNQEVPIGKILKYKQERRNELLALRAYMKEIQKEINSAENEEHLKSILIDSKEDIEKGLGDIAKSLKSGKIKTIVSSLNSLLKLDNPKLIGTLATAGIIGTTINPLIGAAVGGLSIVGNTVSDYLSVNREIESSELSFLFHAKKDKII